jgi:flagellar hook-associated protein 1 FlgK
MSLASALEIGKTGLKIYQVATEVVSENIANVNTPGYSRQRVILEDAPPSTANGFPLGTGVKISSVERYYDKLLQKQLVNASTTSSYDSTKSQVLQQIEPIFNEVAQDGLGDAITSFFNAWQDLSLNPAGTAERQAVLSQGKILADQFNYTSTTLTNAISQQDQSLIPLVGDATNQGSINTLLNNIAQLNGQIKTTEQVSGNANEMRDQRDYLVRQLGSDIGINYTENSDGTTDVTTTIGGTTYALVTGSTAGSFSSQVNGVTGKNDVYLQEVGAGAAVQVTPATGQLGSIITMRDTTIQGYLDQVNTLATSIATAVNTQQTSGYALNSATQSTDLFFSPATSAGTITVNTALTTTMIAASGSPNTNGDNTNALAIAKLNTLNGYSNTYDALVAQVGVDVQAAKTTVSQDDAFTKQLTTLRDSNSGVSLDEELVALIQYQKSYQASAKLITTAGDMMDTVINMIK